MKNSVSTLFLCLGLAAATACDGPNAGSGAVAARARAHLDSGKFDLAIAQFDSAIRMNPNDADAYNSRGNAYASKRDHDRALASFDSAIRLLPTHHIAFRNRGLSHRDKGDLDRAIQDLDKAIALKPDFAGAFNSRGFIHQLKGDYERALGDYDRSISLAPESPVVYRNRANVRFILGHLSGAASDLERSVKFVEASTPAPTRFNESGGYAVVWLHVARMRLGHDDAAEFAVNAARVDSAYWPRPVISFFEGKLTSNQLVEQTALVADSKLRNDQRCGAEFFAGQAAIWKQQLAEARKRFETITTTCSKQFSETAVAAAELARLGPATK